MGRRRRKRRGWIFPAAPTKGRSTPRAQLRSTGRSTRRGGGSCPLLRGTSRMAKASVGPIREHPLLIPYELFGLSISAGADSTAGEPKGGCLQPRQHQGSLQ